MWSAAMTSRLPVWPWASTRVQEPCAGVRTCGVSGRYSGGDRCIFFAFPRRSDVTDTLPDRLCVDPTSRYYDEKILARNVGILFNGVERTNVEEYCVSEGWIRSAVGKTLDRRGKPLTVQLKGKVEPFFKD